MKIRTIKQAIRDLKREDPECGMTHYMLTKLVKEGVIPCIHNDRFYFVDLDLIKTYLEKGVS